MRYRNVGVAAVSLALALVTCGRSEAQPDPSSTTTTDQPPPTPPEEHPAGSEVLTRGPVHEAFDQPVTIQAQAGLVAPKQPPANIQEVPPVDRPQGDHYVWVPGYWSWDAERGDFVWVSACWRVAPPEMSWVPGYWTQAPGGWEWVAGFWAPASAQAIDYLPAPPAPVDVEPPGPPPAVDRVWVPGCWYWYPNGYVRRPGYWLQQRPGWEWVPSHYHWSPRGYVFAEGHWDYAMERRGVLFAPVYFPPAVYERPGFVYGPTIVLDTALLLVDLFAYPRYNHYFFGDFYDESYVRIGIYPRFDCQRFHTWYDPSYQYDRWRHGRTDPHWEAHQRQSYDQLRSNANLRPPRTYSELQTRMAQVPEPQRKNIQTAGPIRTMGERRATPVRFEQLNAVERQQIAKGGSEVHKFREQRAQWEAPTAPPPSAHQPEEREGHSVQAQPSEGKGSARPQDEGRSQKRNVQQDPAFVAPREVHLTQPDHVNIPARPTVGRPIVESGNVQHAPPPPSGEHGRPAEQPRVEPKGEGQRRD